MLSLDTLRTTMRELGGLNAILYFAARALNHCSRHCALYKYYLVAQPVSATARLSGERGKSVTVRQLERGDAALKQMDRPATTLERRFAQQSICLGAFKDAQLVGYIWLHFSAYPEDEVRCCFKPEPATDTAWDFDIYIDPKYRLGYTFPRLWDEADARLRSRRVRWTMSRISAFNPASLTSHARLGIKSIGSATYLIFFRWQLMFTTLRPYIHFSLTRSSHPTIVIRAPD